jgi:flagellar motor protein MotB
MAVQQSPKKRYAFADTDEQEETPLWLVTFADSMSLLLTFFVLLISFSSFEEVSISESMQSISEHLGGGVQSGLEKLRTTYNLAEDEDELAKTFLGLDVSDKQVPFNINEKPIDLDVNNVNKMKALKELLKTNPALLSILIQKNKTAAANPAEAEEKSERESPEIDSRMAQIELSLENLQHYVVSEGLDESFAIQENKNGEISFQIDCAALFEENSATMGYESKQLLLRIARMLKTVPNRIGIQYLSQREFSVTDSFVEDWNVPLSRAEAIIEFFLAEEPMIGEDRFLILARSYTTEEWQTIQKVNTSGEGAIGITMMAFSDDLF